MKVLLTGATGFIGRHLHAALLAAGHTLVCPVRRPRTGPPSQAAQATRWVALDYTQATSTAQWLPLLQGVDAVVNTVGVFREQGGQTFDALHVRAPCALFDACAAAGVRRVVQLSALGADAQAATAYHLSKRAADEHLLALPLQAVVVQPSLVFGAEGGSAQLFIALASLPLLPLPAGLQAPLQPLHVDDLVAVLQALVEAPDVQRGRLAAVGPQALTLQQYLQQLRLALRLPPARVLPVPRWLVAAAARAGDALPLGLLDSAAWQMLQRGNHADAAPFTHWLGHAPRPASAFVMPASAQALRHAAERRWLRPLVQASLAFVWLLTAAVSAGLYPVAQSLALLARVGVPPAWQPLLLYGAAGLDALLGVLTLLPLRRPARRRLWQAQALLIVGYTLLISGRLPEFWLHPYGPLSKNLPMLALLLWLHTLDRKTLP